MTWNDGNRSPWGSPGGSGGQSGGGNGPKPPGGGRGNGPWGQGGGGNGGRPRQTPPGLDEAIERLQRFLRGLLPGGGGGAAGGRGIALLGAGAAALWLASGFYRVQPDEIGVVLRFGAFDRTTLPGLNYHIPWPVESVLRPAVTRINRIEVGFRSGTPEIGGSPQGTTARRDVLEESLMLTGDENIIDIDFAVFWRIRDAPAYLFNTRLPSVTIKAVAESAMREVIGKTPIQPALTELRAQIETEVMKATQTILDSYKVGVEVTQVQLQKVDPPAAVIESFRDVQRANTDAERMRNEAEAYRNDIVPRARGDSARIVAEAEAAQQASVVEAKGQTQRFLSVLAAYREAKDVTLQRMYLDTMEQVLTTTPSVIVDGSLKNVVPFLPLNEAPRPAPQPGSAAANNGAAQPPRAPR